MTFGISFFIYIYVVYALENQIVNTDFQKEFNHLVSQLIFTINSNWIIFVFLGFAFYF